jgi:hypothetical protein
MIIKKITKPNDIEKRFSEIFEILKFNRIYSSLPITA